MGNCIKCGKEIPDGEELCEDCKNEKKEEVVEKIVSEEKAEEVVSEEKEDNSGPKKSMKKTIIAIIVLVAICLIGYCIFNYINLHVGENRYGNTQGNLLNYGYGTSDSTHIYVVAPDNKLENICVYKTDKDGSNSKPIYTSQDSLLSINSYGNSLFMISMTQKYDETTGEAKLDNKILRMSKDGKDVIVINDNEFNDNCYEIFVIDGRIYYIGEDTKTYSMDLYGGTRRLELDKTTGYVSMNKDYIVYNDFLNGDETTTEFETFIYNKATGEAKELDNDKRTYSATIIGESVYYTNQDGIIYKKDLNNLEAEGTKLCETEAYYMNATEEGVYFLNYTDEKQETVSIFKVNLDGTDPKIIKTLESPNGSDFINIIGDYVLVSDSNTVDIYMVLVDKNTGEEVNKVYNLNIEEYWNSTVEKEGANNNPEGEDDLISLDDLAENTVVENTVADKKVENVVENKVQ